MNFGQAIQAGFRNYVNFSGRARRSEYWYWALFALVVQLVVSYVSGSDESAASTVAAIGLLLPSIAVAVRRLHDIDRTGWWLLLWFVPVIGWLVLFYWACLRGTTGPNRFGPDPYEMATALADTPAH